MKKLTGILMVTAIAAVIGAGITGKGAFAETKDDRKWIAQCISDNQNEKGATMAIIQKYCACMNEEMDDNETRTVTQFEKANPGIRKKCEAASGWK